MAGVFLTCVDLNFGMKFCEHF